MSVLHLKYPSLVTISLALSLATMPFLYVAEGYCAPEPSSSSLSTQKEKNETEKIDKADNKEKPYQILKGDTDIEKATEVFLEAKAAEIRAMEEAEVIQKKIDELERILPEQEERSNESIRQRYIMQSSPWKVVESLFSSITLGDVLRNIEYLESISRANLREVNKTQEIKDELERSKDEKESIYSEAYDEYDSARIELATLRFKRTAHQTEGQELSIKQAESGAGEKSIGVAYDGSEQPKDFRLAANPDTKPLLDGADWNMSLEEFVAEWAPRIDKYTAGTPLADQGVNFATAAWKYCIDPRWSVAISNTESSKGQICIRPHNAWGWGAADSDPYNLASEWGSWAEAIEAHAKGLAKGYGYTISIAGAKKYCPYTWQSWYNKTLAQMAMI